MRNFPKIKLFDMLCDSCNADFDRFNVNFSQTSNTSSQKHNTSLEVCVDHVFIRIDSDITIERTSICIDSNLMALCAVKCQRAYVNLIHQNRFCKSLNMSIIMRSLIPNPICITSIYKERTKHIITHILKDRVCFKLCRR